MSRAQPLSEQQAPALNPAHSAVAVTNGMLETLPREQVRAVIAHELAHISNRDVLVSTVAAVVAGAISAIANFLQFSFLFGGGDDEDNPLGLIGTLAMLIIAPIAAMLLQLAVSRQREYLADATGARLVGEGRPLADALETIHARVPKAPMAVNPATEALYIANPLSGAKGMSSLFSTHPPVAERVRRLRALDREVSGNVVLAAA